MRYPKPLCDWLPSDVPILRGFYRYRPHNAARYKNITA